MNSGSSRRVRSRALRQMVVAAADQVGIDRGPLRPESGSDAMVEWSDLIDELRDRILWDDRDYLAGHAFLDLDPAVGDALKEQLGIAEDYFSAAPIEPTSAGLEEIRRAYAVSAADLGPGEAMLWWGWTRLLPGLDPPLCRSGILGDWTRARLRQAVEVLADEPDFESGASAIALALETGCGGA